MKQKMEVIYDLSCKILLLRMYVVPMHNLCMCTCLRAPERAQEELVTYLN